MTVYTHNEPGPGRRPAWKRWVLVAAAVLLAAALLITLFTKKANAPAEDSQEVAHRQTEPAPEKVVGRYLFSGTVVIARAVENEARRADGSIDYDQPFSQFATFNPEQYDAWVFDHECPMTLNNIPYRTQVDNTVFNCRPEFIPAMQKHFPNIIANIANNHTRDMGQDGYEETVRLLEEGGIQTFGNYTPRVAEDICEPVALPVRIQKSDGSEAEATMPVAFCAWHYFEFDPQPGEFEVMERYAKVMPVFAFVQIGVEYRATADDRQITVARGLIDTGHPEFVIENSAHWVQNTEVYKGKLIVYSTGNFIFDQLDDETNRGLSIDTSLSLDYDDNVAGLLALGERCRSRTDDCLRLAEEQQISRPNLLLSYQPVGSSTGFREITRKATPALQTAIEERANWAKTSKELGQSE